MAATTTNRKMTRKRSTGTSSKKQGAAKSTRSSTARSKAKTGSRSKSTSSTTRSKSTSRPAPTRQSGRNPASAKRKAGTRKAAVEEVMSVNEQELPEISFPEIPQPEGSPVVEALRPFRTHLEILAVVAAIIAMVISMDFSSSEPVVQVTPAQAESVERAEDVRTEPARSVERRLASTDSRDRAAERLSLVEEVGLTPGLTDRVARAFELRNDEIATIWKNWQRVESVSSGELALYVEIEADGNVALARIDHTSFSERDRPFVIRVMRELLRADLPATGRRHPVGVAVPLTFRSVAEGPVVVIGPVAPGNRLLPEENLEGLPISSRDAGTRSVSLLDEMVVRW